MAIRSREQLKSYFQPQDEPTAEQMADFIDSMLHGFDGNLIKRVEDVGNEGVKQIVLSDNTAFQVSQTSLIPIRVAIIGGWRVFKAPANNLLNQIENDDIIEGYFAPNYFSQFKVLDKTDLANLNNLEDLRKTKVNNTNTVKFDRAKGYRHEGTNGEFLTGDINIDLTNARDGVTNTFKYRGNKRPQINGAEYVFYHNIVELNDYELWMKNEGGIIYITIPKGVEGGSSSVDTTKPAKPVITNVQPATVQVADTTAPAKPIITNVQPAT